MATITVTPVANGCEGEPTSFTITVNPAVVMENVDNMIVCSENEVNIPFSTSIVDGEVTYSWTNSNTAIGLAAEGTGNISFVSANTNGEPIVATITVTPHYTNNGITCDGENMIFTITVYPKAIMNEVADQTILSREYTEDIIFSSNITDGKVIYQWTNDNEAIGLAAEGTGNILSFMGAAPITTTQVANITVTPIYTDGVACEGNSITFTITVEPTYLVVIAEGIENGTLTDNARVAANGDHYAAPGEEITLTATPDEDYTLENVIAYMLTDNTVNVPVEDDQFFTMPEFDVECSATFIDEDNLLIKPGVIDLGFRPINAWMYSKFFDATNISAEDFDITEMDLTDYSFFNLDEVTLPFTIEAGATASFGINTNYKNVEPGLKNATLAMIASHSRKPYLRNVVANAYTPVEPDVWELATNVTTFPYESVQPTEGVIYDNYQLPGETPDGYDGVYKLVFDHDVILNAEVTGNDPKVVLYDNGFAQVGGPHVNNYHNAPMHFDNTAVIGNEHLEWSLAPYYTYYKYSMNQILYTADELASAGLLPGNINSIEFYSESPLGFTRDNISIWMGNVSVGSLGTTSISTANMDCVYTGSHTQTIGWNEFVFNGDTFVWDGTSNVLVTFVMNHGSYSSATMWICSDPGFAAVSHIHTDSSPYNPLNVNNSMSVYSAYRPNTKFNGTPVDNVGEVMDGSPFVDYGLFAGTYYLVASSTSEDSYTINIDVEDMPLPLAPTAIYPAHMEQGVETPVTFEFELGEYTHEYQLLLGTQYASQEVVVDWTNNLTGIYEAGELYHNTIYYWRINERNSSGVTEGPLWVFTTELNVPENLTADDYELYEGENAVLHWVNVADRSLVGYNIYQDGVKINSTPVTENTYTVSGLTYNMDGYEFAVTAAYNEGESDFSNTVNIQVSGYGIVSGHVYEQDGTTGIAGATVTIVGFDEFDEIQAFEFTTDANGAYSGNVLAGYFFGMAQKEGYQTAADNYGIEVEYDEEVANYNFILNENYNAVARVVAEEIDDNQVHVYWGWDMVEDFESGDLAAFDWVNGTSYPWAVTTTNPYEGTYCMKSTNEGVNSSTSAIEITMTVAEDGEISFFAKPSSESGYDKGFFYIDDVQKMSISGSGDWVEKVYPITAGTHTYKWAYTKDSSLSSNDDCMYIDYITFWRATPPAPEGVITVDFESGMPAGWTTIDADGDGYNWGLISSVYSGVEGHDSSDGVTSESWHSGAGGLNPDNYLVSPQIELGGTISFWAAPYSTYYTGEHFGVFVSTTGTNPSDFTMVSEWTLSSKDVPQGGARDESNNRIGTWNEFSASLSAYAGQTGYVAIRHFNCYDQWSILVDDITITTDRSLRSFQNYNVYRRNTVTDNAAVQIASGITEEEFNDNTWGSATTGIYQWGVSAIYAGNRGESEITWSNKLDKSMNAIVNVAVTTNSNDPVTGAVVTLTNTSEPGLELVYTATLNETGTYTWDEFRKGEYNVTVTLNGFEGVTATESLWDNTNNLSYVLTEIIANIEDLYVSTTGWAMFGNMPNVPPTPGEGQWYYYDNGTAASGIGTNGGQFYWGVMFPAGSFNGNMVTKVSAYDYMYMNGDVTIYNDGNTSPASPVGNTSVSFTGSNDFVEFEFAEPVVVDPTKNVWVVFYNESGATYPAAVCANTGDANGRWVSLDGSTWEDLASYSLNYTFMVRAYIAPGAKGEVTEISYVPQSCNGGTLSADPNANFRSVEYYNVKLDGIMEGTTTLPFFQHNVEGLIEGETYTTSVQKVYTTGESEWVNFDWVYTPCDNFAGLQSDPTAEWQGNDVVLNWVLPTGGDTPPDPQPTTVYDFEDGTLQGWTTIDADGDGFNWAVNTSFGGHNGSLGIVYSQSYDNNYGALNPDNYLVSPQVTLGGQISFYACGQDASWANEHFGVAVSTTTATAAAFTTIQEWTMSAKGVGAPTNVTRDGSRAQGNWYLYTVDLSSYAGQTGYVAIRHFDCTDMFYLDVDDITLGGGGGDTPTPPDPPAGNTYDFEDGTLQGWTTIDADGDGFNWAVNTSFGGHNGSLGIVYSQSYDNNYGALNPDNYLVSPQVTLGGQISFYACGQDASWANEHFGVAVSTTTATAAAFTTIQEWTMSAKGVGAPTNVTRDGSRAQGNWYLYTVDLSSYAGQTGYVAIRHFDCTDMFYLDVDDITLGDGNKGNRSVSYDFEGSLQGWTTLDADVNTSMNWYHSSNSLNQSGYDYTGLGHGGSNGFAVSQSYIDYDGAYQADNYLVSPQMFALQSGSNITFWADNANDSYPDNFGVYIATVANPTPSDFTMVWDGNAKGANGDKATVRHNATRYNNWRQHTVDLSAYAGQTVWIAFRHHDYDEYEIWIDDVTINAEGGDTPTPPDPNPSADIIGVEIFHNGEWLAEVQAPAQTYTVVNAEGGSYEIRVVYDGLTEDYTYYAMSCPQAVAVDDNPCTVVPENLTGSYEWVNGNEFGALINWTYGDDLGLWLYYDEVTENDEIGFFGAGGTLLWSVMFPASDLTAYEGWALTKVSFIEGYAGSYTVFVCDGATAPENVLYQQTVSTTGSEDWFEIELTTSVPVDPTQNLWIVLYNTGVTYPAAAIANTGGYTNASYLSMDGSTWYTMADFGYAYDWVIRAFVSTTAEADAMLSPEPFTGIEGGEPQLSMIEYNGQKTFNYNRGTREPVSFNVYRDGNVIANVPYNGEGFYNYFDNVNIGTYQYQVTAVYDACESDFALTPDESMNYVEIAVTSVSESVESRLYPNPTTGNVTIEANGMTHITVVSLLGQVLYDANISGDTYQMNLGQYEAGLYMVRIYTENGVSVKRVTVAK